MKKLIEDIKKEAPNHGSIPFWSWNDKLEEGELRRQIRNMKELGMKGFFMHARGGLETEYMSEDWFDAVSVCIDEAKKLGMEAWAYDENGWPSGFAGGELLKDSKNFAKMVKMSRSEKYPEIMPETLAVYCVKNNELILVDGPSDADEYISVYTESDFSYVDTMDASVTAKFIEATHKKYKERYQGKGLGKEMPGFFTDEPQYYRWGTPWSDTFLVNFKNRFGYDVKSGLAHLFIDGLLGGEAFRHDYWLICHEQFFDGFMKPIYEWCSENGLKLTGHGIEEWTLSGQMMCSGGVMPYYLYEHIPGIDYLGRDIKDASGIKQIGSVCAQVGKKLVLSEMYACCGWDVTPRELKRIAEVQYAGGVNLTCEHLYAYSERGQRKRDYPNHYSDHTSWQKHYAHYEKYFKQLGAALCQGEELVDTLVIHPIRSAYLHYPRNMAPLEAKYNALIKSLTLDHIAYHFGDETIMRDMGSVEGANIRVGNCLYNKVLLPNLETIDSSTAELLKEYLKNGGKLCVLGDVPTKIDGRAADTSFIKENLPYDRLKITSGLLIKHNGEDVSLHMQIRKTDSGKMIFVVNPSKNEYLNTEVTIWGACGFEELDINTLETRPVRGRKNTDGSVTVIYDFTDSKSCLLVESSAEMLDPDLTVNVPEIKLGDFRLESMPENILLLDKAQVSKNGGEFTDLRPIVRIRDNLLRERFEGELCLKYSFNSEIEPSSLYLVIEPSKNVTVKVNGEQISSCDGFRFDRSFKLFDIKDYVKVGENTITVSSDYYQSEYVYEVLYGEGVETLRNCLVFDTEVEPIYLYGDFGVGATKEYFDVSGGAYPNSGIGLDIDPNEITSSDIKVYRNGGEFYLKSRDEKIDLTDIVKDGYAFFAGEMTVSTIIEYKPGDPTRLKLGGRFSTVRAIINDHDLGVNIFSDEFELAPYLRKGENKLTLTLCFSNRNLMGPHNRENPEPSSVGPQIFSFENEWDGDKCAGYVDAKAFVRFGIGF